MTVDVNFFPHTLEPLFQGVTIHNPLFGNFLGNSATVEKTVLTADEIFGDWYINCHYQGFKENMVYLASGLGLIASCTAIVLPTQVFLPVTFAINLMKGGVFGLVVSGSVMSLSKDKLSDSKADTIVKVCNKITKFSNTFENFKENPDVADVRDLFSKFDRITSFMCEPYLKHFEGLDVNLLSGTGKLFLMDAVVKLLQKDATSPYLEEWTSTLVFTKDSGFSEPWQRLGIDNPNKDAYIDYALRMDDFESLEINDKIIQAFKEINIEGMIAYE